MIMHLPNRPFHFKMTYGLTTHASKLIHLHKRVAFIALICTKIVSFQQYFVRISYRILPSSEEEREK